MINIIIRVIKGIFIGAGFIMPGLSGGAMAALFGLYERVINFLADIRKDFLKNLLFFIPVGIGGILGLFLFSMIINIFFDIAEVSITWFFIGCIIGMLPSLWQKAGEHKRIHYIAFTISFLSAGFLMFILNTFAGGQPPLNTITWGLAGALIAIGIVAPGLSSSSLLLFLHMYAPMTYAIANFDLSVILPMAAGGIIAIIVFSKIIAKIIKKASTGFYHVIIGFILASTIAIIPGFDIVIINIISIIAGVALAWGFSKL